MEAAHHEPAITVVIPTFDRAASVGAAIASVLGQVGPPVEVIVVDDGSIDGTLDALGALADPRVRVIPAPHEGVCAARNRGAAAARAPWLTFLDSDDTAAAGWLEAFAGGLADGAQLVTCAATLRYPDGTSHTPRPVHLGPAFGSVTAHFLAGSFAVTTELFRAVGGYRLGLVYGENTELGMRLGTELAARGAHSASDQRPLLEVAAIRRTYDAQRYLSAGLALMAEPDHPLRRDRHLYASYLAIAGVAASRLGRTQQAFGLLARAWRTEPGNWRHPFRLVRALSPVRRLR